MPRGGQNKKSIEEHIANGTYRPSLHGYLNKSDEATLKEMKNELYTSFVRLTKEIETLNLVNDLDRYKYLNELKINTIKAFHSIAKTPVEDKPENNIDKDGFK